MDLDLSFRRLEYGCHNPGKDTVREERDKGRRGRRIGIWKSADYKARGIWGLTIRAREVYEWWKEQGEKREVEDAETERQV